MPAARIVALPFFLVLAGCIASGPVPPGEPPAGAKAPETGAVKSHEAAPAQAKPIAIEPSEKRTTQGETVAVKPPETGLTQDHTVAGKPTEPAPPKGEIVAVPPPMPGATSGGMPAEPVVRATPSQPSPGDRGVAKPDTPAAKTPSKVAALPTPAEQIKKKESAIPAPAKAPVPATPAAAKPSPPPLDLVLLEKRLKETDAIGVFTKLTLKNQVDDLLDRFRAYHRGRVKTTLPQLRQPYDMLILKVLSLLQDSDPSLATAIASSREAIWGILSDREKFANL